VRTHAGWIGGGGIELAHDPPAGFLPALLDDLASHRLFEPGHAEATGAIQLAPVTLDDHDQRRRPAPRLEGLLGRLERGWPHALEQCPHLLDLAHHLHDQLLAPRTKMPQPTPRLLNGFRHVATQLGGQPSDQHRVLLIGLVRGQVLLRVVRGHRGAGA